MLLKLLELVSYILIGILMYLIIITFNETESSLVTLMYLVVCSIYITLIGESIFVGISGIVAMIVALFIGLGHTLHFVDMV